MELEGFSVSIMNWRHVLVALICRDSLIFFSAF